MAVGFFRGRNEAYQGAWGGGVCGNGAEGGLAFALGGWGPAETRLAVVDARRRVLIVTVQHPVYQATRGHAIFHAD
jgi:hypothetical protein